MLAYAPAPARQTAPPLHGRRAASPLEALLLATLLTVAPVAEGADPPNEGEPPPNALRGFGQLSGWQSREAGARLPLSLGPVDYLPLRALAPPMLKRDGWQPRIGAALEWSSNPRLASGGSPSAHAQVLLTGLQYKLRTPLLAAGFDASLEAIETSSADLKVDTLDAATFSGYGRGRATERLFWEATTLLQRTHEPDGGLIPDANQRRFRADVQRHRVELAWRMRPTLDVFSRADAALLRSRDPAAVATDNTSLAVGVAWRRAADQRLSASLHSRHFAFDRLPDAQQHTLQLKWEQQWSPRWLTELMLGAGEVRGQSSPVLWRLSVLHSRRNGSGGCSAEHAQEAPGTLGRLLNVQRARCDAEWRVGSRARARAGLEAVRYRLDGGITLQSLRPRLALLWPLDDANWLQLRATAIDDRLSDGQGRRRELRLQATFIHTFH